MSRRLIFSCGIVTTLAASAGADTFFWTGSCGGDNPYWHGYCISGYCGEDESSPMQLVNNWGDVSCYPDTPDSYPSAGDDVVIFEDATLNAPAEVNNVSCPGSLTLAHTLNVTSYLDVHGNLTFDYGGLTGSFVATIAPGATGSTTNFAGSIEYGSLTNYGTFTFNGSGYGFVIHNGASFHNEGLVVLPTNPIFDSSLEGYSDNPGNAFFNNGTLRKMTYPGAFPISGLSFHNTGLVEIQDGTLLIGGGGTNSGTFDIHSDAILETRTPFNPFTLEAGTTFPNSGLVLHTSGILELSADMTIPNLHVTGGGTLTNNAVLTSHELRFDLATLNGTGSIVMPVGSDLYIGGNTFLTHTIVNAGTLHWTHPGTAVSLMSGFVLENTGLLLGVQGGGGGPSGASPKPQIRNSGTLQANGGFGFSYSEFENAGFVDVQSSDLNLDNYTQTAGTTRIASGARFGIYSEGEINIVGGILEGSGDIVYGQLHNSGGVVSPGLPTGTLRATVGYRQEAGGTLKIELGGSGPGEYDRLEVSAFASTLDGTLQLDLINGYVPIPGDSFVIMTFNSRTGAFADVTMPPASPCGGGPAFQVVYNSNNVTVVAVNPACPHPGDFNGDALCSIDDIPGFVGAKLAGGYTACADTNLDCENDGRDVQTFVQCLFGH